MTCHHFSLDAVLRCAALNCICCAVLLSSEEHVSLLFLFVDDLKVLIDDGDSQEDTSAATNGSKKISDDCKHSDTHPTKSCSSGNVHVEGVQKRSVSVSLEHHLLVSQLFRHVPRGGARHLNPGFGEEGAGNEDEEHVEESMERIVPNIGE